MKPVILGGIPVFKDKLRLVSPYMSSLSEIEHDFKNFYNKGILTKGEILNIFEAKIAKYLGVRNVICVSSCTLGLMLVLKALDLKGSVILPSHTFIATGNAVLWNNLKPIFVDVNPRALTINEDDILSTITPNTSAIIATHIHGNPCNVIKLMLIAKKHNLKLIFDAAHAFGSEYKGTKVGSFGDAEVFSCSPTKTLVTGEGGIITTNNDQLANDLRVLLEYGNPGNYDCVANGLNARMSEFNALLGCKNIKAMDKIIKNRVDFANYIRDGLSGIAGINFQYVSKDSVSSYKDLVLVLDDNLHLSRDEFVKCLTLENIETRNYYDPPLHLQTVFKEFNTRELLVTNNLHNNILSLPISSEYSYETASKLILVIKRIVKYKECVARKIR